ncbi:MAG: HlyD family secretion protein, partial [Gammaproteobacteria bacterium]|nr:HlyD family secretion protein [Gammaproteobacteria bacterium]
MARPQPIPDKSSAQSASNPDSPSEDPSDGADKSATARKTGETTPAASPASPSSPASAAAETESQPRRHHGGRRRRFNLQRLLVLVLVVIGVAVGVREVRQRMAFVYEVDSRITAELVTISSRVSGRVTAISAVEGSAIGRDEVMVSIDSRESQLLVEQLEAQIKGAEAELNKLRAQREFIDLQTSTRIDAQLSQANAAAASLAALDPQLELARSELQRSESLFSKRVIAKQQLDQARALARKVDGEHRMAAAELDEARSKLDEARAERAQLRILDEELEVLQQSATVLRSRLAQQRLDLDDRSIRSPLEGVVDKIFIEVGEYVSPGQRLALVHDPNQIWIEANIKETEIRRLRVGQPVEVTVDSFPDEPFQGTVAVIGHATTASFALLPNPNPSGNFTKVTQR